MENSNVTPLVPKEKSDRREILNSLTYHGKVEASILC